MFQLNSTKFPVKLFETEDTFRTYNIKFPSHTIREHTIVWEYEGPHEIFQLMQIRELLEGEVKLIIKKIPFYKQAGVVSNKTQFSLVCFAKVINSLAFSKVITYDCTTDIAKNLIDGLIDMPCNTLISFASSSDNYLFVFENQESFLKYNDYLSLDDKRYLIAKKDGDDYKFEVDAQSNRNICAVMNTCHDTSFVDAAKNLCKNPSRFRFLVGHQPTEAISNELSQISNGAYYGRY